MDTTENKSNIVLPRTNSLSPKSPSPRTNSPSPISLSQSHATSPKNSTPQSSATSPKNIKRTSNNSGRNINNRNNKGNRKHPKKTKGKINSSASRRNHSGKPTAKRSSIASRRNHVTKRLMKRIKGTKRKNSFGSVSNYRNHNHVFSSNTGVDITYDEIKKYFNETISRIPLTETEKAIREKMMQFNLNKSLEKGGSPIGNIKLNKYLIKWDVEESFFMTMNVNSWLNMNYSVLFDTSSKISLKIFKDQIIRAIYILDKISLGNEDLIPLIQTNGILHKGIFGDDTNNVYDFNYPKSYIGDEELYNEINKKTLLYLDGPGRFTYCLYLVLSYKYHIMYNNKIENIPPIDNENDFINKNVKIIASWYLKLINEDENIINFITDYFPRHIIVYYYEHNRYIYEDSLSFLHGNIITDVEPDKGYKNYYFNFMGILYETKINKSATQLVKGQSTIKPEEKLLQMITLFKNIKLYNGKVFITLFTLRGSSEHYKFLIGQIKKNEHLFYKIISNRGGMNSIEITIASGRRDEFKERKLKFMENKVEEQREREANEAKRLQEREKKATLTQKQLNNIARERKAEKKRKLEIMAKRKQEQEQRRRYYR